MMKNVSTVYIPQEPRKKGDDGDWHPLYDLSPALEFGILEVLLPSGPMLLDGDAVIEIIKGKLEDITENDYLMLIGDPTAIAASVMVASSLLGGKLKLLKYDRSERKYNAVKYSL